MSGSIFGLSDRKNHNPFKRKESEVVEYTPRRDGLTIKRNVKKKMKTLEKSIDQDDTITPKIKN
jgi:hypothetical protein